MDDLLPFLIRVKCRQLINSEVDFMFNSLCPNCYLDDEEMSVVQVICTYVCANGFDVTGFSVRK